MEYSGRKIKYNCFNCPAGNFRILCKYNTHILLLCLRFFFSIFRPEFSVEYKYNTHVLFIFRPEYSVQNKYNTHLLLMMHKTAMATSKSFSSVAPSVWNSLPGHLTSIPTLPVFRRALKHHLFLLAYPNSSAKSGKIIPAQCITLRDTAPTTATVPPGNTMPPI